MKSLNSTDANGAGVRLEPRELERVAEAALCAARLLMETGVPATVVHEECSHVARGLGAEHVDLRSGYASVDITIATGTDRVTRLSEVGALGVNYRLAHAIRTLVRRISDGGFTSEQAIAELRSVEERTGHHAPWVVASSVGMACACFGRLLGMDWAAFIPVAVAGTVGQWVRHLLLRRSTNVFVVAGCVALMASAVAGMGARLAGSTTVELAMLAAVLLLVPGVPMLDAQRDILEGHPTLGTARAVVVIMILICIAMGVLIARALLGVQR